VFCSWPRALPIATTLSPTFTLSELPRVAAFKYLPFELLTLRKAKLKAKSGTRQAVEKTLKQLPTKCSAPQALITAPSGAQAFGHIRSVTPFAIAFRNV